MDKSTSYHCKRDRDQAEKREQELIIIIFRRLFKHFAKESHDCHSDSVLL